MVILPGCHLSVTAHHFTLWIFQTKNSFLRQLEIPNDLETIINAIPTPRNNMCECRKNPLTVLNFYHNALGGVWQICASVEAGCSPKWAQKNWKKKQGNYSLGRPPKLIITKDIHWPKRGYLHRFMCNQIKWVLAPSL